MLFNPSSHQNCVTCGRKGRGGEGWIWCRKYGHRRSQPENGCSGWEAAGPMRLAACGGEALHPDKIAEALDAAHKARPIGALLLRAGCLEPAVAWAKRHSIAVECFGAGQVRQMMQLADGLVAFPKLRNGDALCCELADEAWLAVWRPFG